VRGAGNVTRPKIRPLNAFPVESEGKQYICLQDPLRFCEKQLFIDYQTYFIIALMDGEHDIPDIQLEYTRKFGEILLDSRINDIIGELGSNFLLEGPEFERERSRLVELFRKQPIRHAAHAGLSYKADAEKLRKQLDQVLSIADDQYRSGDSGRHLLGLMAPHIDIGIGAEGYAHGYGLLRDAGPADLYIILGVSHTGGGSGFILTSKDFDTPLGTAITDQAFLKELCTSLDTNYFEDELIHKTEHSIEFQTVFLQHLFGNANYRIVPILCSGFHTQLDENSLPESDPGVAGFLNALKDSIESYGGRVCVIAGVDLSHVGGKFGTPGGIDRSQLPAIEQLDREMLEIIKTGEPQDFFRDIEKDKNGRNVCGFAAIYSLMFVLPQTRRELLHYGRSYEVPTSSMVSFASMAFYET
jgi:AmmeMemoRadiSam system protein B